MIFRQNINVKVNYYAHPETFTNKWSVLWVECQNVAKQPRKQGINSVAVPNVSPSDENDSDDDDHDDDDTDTEHGEHEQTHGGPVLLPALLQTVDVQLSHL